MNKLFLGFLAIAFSLTSCSTEEAVVVEQTSDSMLKSFVVSRNADGSYGVTHEVTEGVSSVYTDNKTDKEIFLFQDNTATKVASSQDYTVENNRLNILFADENNSSLPQISIADNNTSTKSGDLDLLNNCSLTYTDGTLELNFEVEAGVEVAFGTTDGVNDIYLVEGDATQTNYTKSYTKEAGSSLQIDFVQTLNKSTEIKHPSYVVYQE